MNFSSEWLQMRHRQIDTTMTSHTFVSILIVFFSRFFRFRLIKAIWMRQKQSADKLVLSAVCRTSIEFERIEFVAIEAACAANPFSIALTQQTFCAIRTINTFLYGLNENVS